MLVETDGMQKLIDFGLSRRISIDSAWAKPSARQEHGRMVDPGTPFYMSPEQARGQTVDGARYL